MTELATFNFSSPEYISKNNTGSFLIDQRGNRTVSYIQLLIFIYGRVFD